VRKVDGELHWLLAALLVFSGLKCPIFQ
jgi:hypothetical protein